MQGDNSTPWPSVEELAGLQGAQIEPNAETRAGAQGMGAIFAAYQQAGFTRLEAFALIVEHIRGARGGAR